MNSFLCARLELNRHLTVVDFQGGANERKRSQVLVYLKNAIHIDVGKPIEQAFARSEWAQTECCRQGNVSPP